MGPAFFNCSLRISYSAFIDSGIYAASQRRKKAIVKVALYRASGGFYTSERLAEAGSVGSCI